MRILLGVHQFFPKYYTGTERYVLNLARQLQRLGHYVKVLTYAFQEEEQVFREGNSPGMEYREYSYEGVPVIALRHKRRPEDLAFLFDFSDEMIYREVKGIFEGEHFDIYHCTHPLRIAASIQAARDSGVKVVFMVTDFFLMCPQGIMLRSDNTLCDGPDRGRNCARYCFTRVGADRLEKRISEARQLIECSDRLLSPSLFLIRLFDHAGVIPYHRFLHSPHGFDYTKKKRQSFREPNGAISFGYIGTIQYHKGVHIMVEGFKRARHRDMRLEVWGGCYHETEYQKRLLKIANNDSRISFRGKYDYNDIEEILEAVDMVIVPSIWYENAPLTIITSHAHGIPVIASDIGGMSEMVRDGENGLTFRVGAPSDLAKKIGMVVKNPGLVSDFTRKIRYPIRVEEEAFNAEQLYRTLVC